MRVMLVHPGAPFATADVYDGYAAGLTALGVDLITCRLDNYIQFVDLAIKEAGDALINPNTIALAGAFVAQRALIEWPDLLVVIGATNMHRGTIQALTRAGLRTVAVLIDSPYLLDVEAGVASAYAYVTTNERQSVASLIDAVGHSRVRYLPTAYNPTRHTPDGPTLEPCDVAFIGSIFPERRALFDAADFSGLRCVIGGLELNVPMDKRKVYHNDGVASLYRSARVNLNHHRTTMVNGDGRTLPPGAAESLGPRAYEIAACGGFQLVDDARPEARDVFGDALATYRAGDGVDLARQTRYWLANDARRERVQRAQHEAVQGHSYTERASVLLEWAS